MSDSTPPVVLPKDVTCLELKAMQDEGAPIFVLDVRNPEEHEFCRIADHALIPLSQLPARMGELDPSRAIVVYCRSGGRSGKAADMLRQKGFANVANLTGGILAWSDQIDPSIPKY